MCDREITLSISLLGFAVRLMLTALRTELFHFETLGCRLLVLHVRVVSVLALSALKGDDFARHRLLLPFFFPTL
jgi:hypothetical protein